MSDWKQLLAKDHPVWPCIRILVVVGSVSIILALNATNFDSTEVKTILEVGGIAAVVEGVKRKVTS